MTEPLPPDPGKPGQPVTDPVRRYDLAFDRRYEIPPPPPEPPPLPGQPGYDPKLVPVTWDGLPLNFSEDYERGGYLWTTGVVENVEGWYATPGMDGHNADRALSDGAIAGPKTLAARTVSISGAAVGPRPRLMEFRDQLAYRAQRRVPAELIIGDRWLGTALSAMVRADSDSLKHTFFAGPQAFRYEVTLTAHDWRLYEQQWQQAVLTTVTDADAGRPYDRLYWNPRDDPPPAPLNGWAYQHPYPPGSAAYLRNTGNAPAPVYAVYDGDLAESRLTDGDRSLYLAPLQTGVQILANTETMAAEAPGGLPRASWVLPGSRPLTIAPHASPRWHLYSEGSGKVTLSWRSTWI